MMCSNPAACRASSSNLKEASPAPACCSLCAQGTAASQMSSTPAPARSERGRSNTPTPLPPHVQDRYAFHATFSKGQGEVRFWLGSSICASRVLRDAGLAVAPSSSAQRCWNALRGHACNTSVAAAGHASSQQR